MEKIFFLSFIISVVFFIIKAVEMKYFDKQPKPLKLIVRDTIVVFVCSFIPILMYFQFDGKMSEIFQMGEEVVGPTEVFTGEPEF
tara:strand:+ start:2283 stop:2537 length:255 start_codon:yes stop_codon:yes gene_type:complete